MAVEFLLKSSQGGVDLAETIFALNVHEFVTPITDLNGFAKRLGPEGLAHLRTALEQQSYPDRSLLAQLNELQKDEGAWIELKLASPSEEDQIVALEKIKTSQSPQNAIERARILLEAQEKAKSERLRVRQWGCQDRSVAGKNPSDIANDAWEVFERQPCSQDTWKLLEDWSRRAGTWESVRTRALEHLRRKETGKYFDNFRLTRVRIARDEGRERDAWEIARLGLSHHEMEEAIFRAFPHWLDEALVEFDKLLESSFKGLEGTNSQSVDDRAQMAGDLEQALRASFESPEEQKYESLVCKLIEYWKWRNLGHCGKLDGKESALMLLWLPYFGSHYSQGVDLALGATMLVVASSHFHRSLGKSPVVAENQRKTMDLYDFLDRCGSSMTGAEMVLQEVARSQETDVVERAKNLMRKHGLLRD